MLGVIVSSGYGYKREDGVSVIPVEVLGSKYSLTGGCGPR